MKNLSNYEQTDLLKCLNFDQLFSFQQTNYYFNLLIEQNKWILALKEMDSISICESYHFGYDSSCIEPKSNIINYPVNDQLLEKWQSAIDKRIPLYLFNDDRPGYSDDKIIYIISSNKDKGLHIKLPNYPKNIQEMKFIYFWLEQLFRCSFEEATCYHVIINPEIIKLLFDNISPKFYIKTVYPISFHNSIYKYQFEFIFDHLVITDIISLDFQCIDYKEQNNLLLNLIFNSGKRIPYFSIEYVKDPSILISSIINYIKMSKDCSQMVPKIKLRAKNGLGLKVEIKEDKIEKNDNFEKIVLCEYKNIYDPAIKFLAKVYYLKFKDEMIFDIARIKEE